MNYRNDINGLRAIAVLPVLFFHSQWSLFSGGFLGVDVFFVISGFLITSLIIGDLHKGEFSLLSFYDRRARRILPALLLTCIVTTITAFFFMLPYDLKNFGQSLVATLLSANNILLYLTSGYWSLAAEFKPLYHTWSLAVEEQYYTIIPALLLCIFLLVKKKSENIAFTIICLLCIVSFSLSLLSINKEWDFLIITNRMWELLVGSICAFLALKDIKKSNVIALSGLFLIGISYVFPYALSEKQAIYSLFPVLGTALIILFSSNTLLTGKLLAIKPLFLIGTLSYSIYLFHMPVLAFLRLSLEGESSVLHQSMIVLTVIPLAYVSVKYVENVFRDKRKTSNTVFYSGAALSSVLLLGLGFTLHKTYGFQEAFSQYSYGENPQRYADRPYRLQASSFSDEAKENLLVIGDSFARDTINMFLENQLDKQYEIIYLYDYQADIALSQQLVQQAHLTLAVTSAGVAGRINKEKVTAESKRLLDFLSQNAQHHFYLLGTKNFGYNNNFVKHKSRDELIDYRVHPNHSSLVANKIEKTIWKTHYIDFFSILMSKQGTVPLFTPEGKFISFDTDHFTQDGARYLGKVILSYMNTHDILTYHSPRESSDIRDMAQISDSPPVEKEGSQNSYQNL